jgi:hypothetical protein
MRGLTYALEFVRQAAAPNAPAEPITSNFLVDKSNPKGELIAYHFGVVYLP